ncbi:MAG: PIN domain-containing protein [Chloroflexota bacterium]|nr:PIN domain-containing protein [Chloroflexota bacterium]MDE2947783.1 PIN domain-containing protein [Chloroflexota bacterium]
MSIIADTSFVFALYNPIDAYHQRAMAFASDVAESVLLPSVILPELGFLFERDLGYAGVVQFFQQFRYTESHLEPLLNSDLARVFEIAQQYANAEFDVVDCCIMALAERLQITKIATFDRRDFHIVRPVHTDYFEIVP